MWVCSLKKKAIFKPKNYSSSFSNLNKIDLKQDNKILKISAVKNPFTAKPVTNLPAIKIIHALITNKNKPSVRIVTGKVKITNSGRTNIFKIEIVRATKIAVV